jgi:FkbM family methyltransferase
LRSLIIKLYQNLPFAVAVALSRIKPALAFYIKPGRCDLVIDDFLGCYRINVDTHSDIERRLLSRQYEPDTLRVIEKVVKPGQVCVDIGANVGAITLALARMVGPEGRVQAFEPGPPLFERLRKNLEMNPSVSGRVEIHQLGLSDKPGKLFWQESQLDSGNATIHWADPSRPGVHVAVTTIDSLADKLGWDAVHFVKIDVEGMERQVLSGALKTIRRHRPVIFFETSLCDEEQKQAGREIQEMLTQLGYRLYKIIDGRGSIRPTSYPDFSMNTLAIPEGESPREDGS